MKLIELIVNIFNLRWYDKIFVNAYHEYKRFSSFIKDVLQFCNLIDEAQNIYGSDLKFALWGINSTSYIVAYIALILKNVDFYLIPAEMNKIMVSSIILNSDINVLLSTIKVDDYEVTKKIHNYPCFKFTFNISTKTFVGNKSISNIINLKTIFSMITDNIVDIKNAVMHNFKVKKRNRNIVVFSSGTDSVYPKAVYFHDNEIYNALMKVVNSELLPCIHNKNVYVEANFSMFSVWGILWPLYSNARFVFSRQEANVIITCSGIFDQHFNDVSREIYETKFFGKLLLRISLSWLFTIIARYNLKRFFNFGTKKEAIIIINAFLSSRIMKIIVDHLPIYTTYGIQETNQVIAVNNYSSKYHRKSNCVGEFLENINGSIRETNIQTREGSLVLMSDHFANSVQLEEGVYYDTRDHASLSMPCKEASFGPLLIFIYGKMKYIIKDSVFEGSNYENIERILKNVPYFKEVLLYKDEKGNFHICIFPNKEIVEANNFGLLDFQNFIKSYGILINDKYGIDFIEDVKVIHTDFLKTPDLKIKKALYFAATIVAEEEL